MKKNGNKMVWIVKLNPNPNSVVVFNDPIKGTFIHIGPGMSKLSLFVIKALQKILKEDEKSEKSISSIREDLEREIEILPQ